MLKQIRTLTLIAFALAIAASVAVAEPITYRIDINHSVVGFKVRHFFSKTPGRFNDYSGKIVYDDKNLAGSSVDVTIQATSIYTNNEKRDNHLRSDDFFSVEKFPTLTFKSTKVEPGDGTNLKVHGDLTIRGVTKPVTLDAELVGKGPLAIGGQSMGNRAGFVASTKVNRKDFGIIWNKTLDQGGTMLGDDVAIEIEVELIEDVAKAEAKPAAPAPATTAK